MTSGKRDPFGGKTYAERVAGQEQQPARVDHRPKPMTYRIGEVLIDRINRTADAYNVEKQGLVRALLRYALDALDREEWELDIEEKRRRVREE
jgi:hypothetical protein